MDGLAESSATTTTTPTIDSMTTADEAVPITIGQICKPINASNVRQSSSAAEQYWEHTVLGIHNATLRAGTVDINGY